MTPRRIGTAEEQVDPLLPQGHQPHPLPLLPNRSLPTPPAVAQTASPAKAAHLETAALRQAGAALPRLTAALAVNPPLALATPPPLVPAPQHPALRPESRPTVPAVERTNTRAREVRLVIAVLRPAGAAPQVRIAERDARLGLVRVVVLVCRLRMRLRLLPQGQRLVPMERVLVPTSLLARGAHLGAVVRSMGGVGTRRGIVEPGAIQATVRALFERRVDGGGMCIG